MHFNLTDEQRALQEMVQRFLAQEYGFEARRRIVRSPEGWSREAWSRFAEMGLLGLHVPEEHGGMGPAPVETWVTLGAMGKALVVEPYLSSAVMGTALVRALAGPEQARSLLPALAAGETIAVLAHGEEGARHERSRVATTATRSGDGWVLQGRKAVVLHAPAAGILLVTARTSGAVDAEDGLSVFAVPAAAPGVRLVAYPTIDGQRGADVELAGVALPPGALLGEEGRAFAAIDAALDLGVAGLCAEAVGALQATLDATLEYTRTRKQFGVPIGRFQALQHRMADMLLHVEQARSMSILAAMRAGSADVRERRRSVSAAKVTVGQACRYVGQQAVQLHGGMGVTDELPVSHLFKRLLAIELGLGDTQHHLERFITESA
ncbi:MAG TPA: acyl-CoA dehydrogenase [Anaeromyxobacteraceae bacterium]|nr:acyl-CoA dehydrogenase [Anaeromyxobacteraceae bacterium]